MHKLVCRLRKAHYGHPRAGDLWAGKLSAVLKSHQFEAVENWPSCFIRYGEHGLIVFDIYVDDLMMYGPDCKGGLRDVLKEVRKEISMEEPHPLGRYLGVERRTKISGTPGKRTTEAEFDMIAFFKAKVDAYVNDSQRTLGTVDSPHVPKLDNATFEANLEREGELTARQCASHFVGCLYGARMAHPAISVAITRLASHITTWSAECDRRLERLFAYLATHPAMVLPGCLSEEDRPHTSIKFWPDADLNGDEFHTKSTSGCWIELAELNGRA